LKKRMFMSAAHRVNLSRVRNQRIFRRRERAVPDHAFRALTCLDNYIYGYIMRGMQTDPAPVIHRPPSLGVLIGQVRNELVRALETELHRQGVDLRYTQFLALKRLAMDGPMHAGELARALEHDAGAMTRVIDQLEKKGYVVRQPNPQDRRALRLAVTESGMATWQLIAKSHERTLERAQHELTTEERAQLFRALERIHAALCAS
jgi:DNA-binding MarR family transcriptional regulator